MLVQRLGAVWAAVSGIALIAPAWAAELVGAYSYNATWGTRWKTPDSELEIAIFLALVFGVCIYNGIFVMFREARRSGTATNAHEAAQDEQKPLKQGNRGALEEERPGDLGIASKTSITRR